MPKQTKQNTSNDLSQARRLIKECLETQNPYLELGNCGITDLGDLPELFNCTHLETLILSNKWDYIEKLNYNESKNKGNANKLSKITPAITKLKNLKKFNNCRNN